MVSTHVVVPHAIRSTGQTGVSRQMLPQQRTPVTLSIGIVELLIYHPVFERSGNQRATVLEPQYSSTCSRKAFNKRSAVSPRRFSLTFSISVTGRTLRV